MKVLNTIPIDILKQITCNVNINILILKLYCKCMFCINIFNADTLRVVKCNLFNELLALLFLAINKYLAYLTLIVIC